MPGAPDGALARANERSVDLYARIWDGSGIYSAMLRQIVWISIGLMLYAAPAGARPKQQETINIRVRHGNALCEGSCPSFTIAIDPSGRIISRSLWSGRIARHKAGPDQLEAFRRILDTLRPTGSRQLDVSCERSRMADGTPLDDPRPDDLEIRWSGPSSAPARLASCAYTHPSMRQTVEKALEALGIDLFETSGPGN